MTENPAGTPARPASFRWKAFGVHLGISLMVLSGLLYMLFVHWFPGHFFDTDGGWDVLRIIILVDLVLGPLLTLVAASPSKTTRQLRLDFSVIALLQACAFVWGAWMAWDNRPYALLWVDGEFHSMPYSTFREYPAARARIAELPGDWPRQVIVRMPEDLEMRGQLLANNMRTGKTVMFAEELYVPFSLEDPEARALADRYARKLLGRDDARADLVRAGLIEPDLVSGRVLLFPVYTRQKQYHLAWRLPGPVLERHDFRPYTAVGRSRQENAARLEGTEAP